MSTYNKAEASQPQIKMHECTRCKSAGFPEQMIWFKKIENEIENIEKFTWVYQNYTNYIIRSYEIIYNQKLEFIKIRYILSNNKKLDMSLPATLKLLSLLPLP